MNTVADLDAVFIKYAQQMGFKGYTKEQFKSFCEKLHEGTGNRHIIILLAYRIMRIAGADRIYLAASKLERNVSFIIFFTHNHFCLWF